MGQKTFKFRQVKAECWECTSHIQDKHLKVRVNKRNYNLHHIIYEHNYGAVKDTEVVHHLCENPRCLNPIHLVKMSRIDHMRHHSIIRASIKVAQIHPEYGVLKVWDSLTEASQNGYTRSNITLCCASKVELYMDCWWMKVRY